MAFIRRNTDFPSPCTVKVGEVVLETPDGILRFCVLFLMIECLSLSSYVIIIAFEYNTTPITTLQYAEEFLSLFSFFSPSFYTKV